VKILFDHQDEAKVLPEKFEIDPDVPLEKMATIQGENHSESNPLKSKK